MQTNKMIKSTQTLSPLPRWFRFQFINTLLLSLLSRRITMTPERIATGTKVVYSCSSFYYVLDAMGYINEGMKVLNFDKDLFN